MDISSTLFSTLTCNSMLTWWLAMSKPILRTEVGPIRKVHTLFFFTKMRVSRVWWTLLTMGRYKKTLQQIQFLFFVMERLTEQQRWIGIGMLQTESRQVDVARNLNVSQSVVSRLWNRYQNFRRVADLPRTGRPRVTTRRQDQLLVTQALRTRTLNATQLQQQLQQTTGIRVSTQTVRNRLHQVQLASCRPFVALLMSPQHRRARMDWCQRHHRWTNEQWASVIFLMSPVSFWILMIVEYVSGDDEVSVFSLLQLLHTTVMEVAV